jgi:hypothetical protein
MCIWSFFDHFYSDMTAIDYMGDQNKVNDFNEIFEEYLTLKKLI